MAEASRSSRRPALLALAGGLSVAALLAIGAVLVGRLTATDLRLVGTSLGFSLFSALGAAGVAARQRTGRLGGLGGLTALAAGAGFGLLLIAIWMHPAGVWRGVGVLTLLALAGSHSCLVLTARDDADPPLVHSLVTASLCAGAFDALVGILALTGLVDHLRSGFVRLVAAVAIVFVLTSVLPPILRRATRESTARPQ